MVRFVRPAFIGSTVLGSLIALPAMAAIDTTAAVASITDAGTALGAVGGAILVLAGIALAYRWVKAAFF